MNYPDIEVFLKILQFGSLSAAADELGISQPSLSKRLTSLESDIGLPLFERGRGLKSVELTDAGHHFLPIAKQWQLLWKEISEFPSSISQTGLRIAGNPSLIHLYLKDTLALYKERQKDQFLYSTGMYSLQTYREIEEYGAEIGFVSNTFESTTVETRPLWREGYSLLYGKNCEQIDNSPLRFLPLKREVLFNWDASFIEWHKYVYGATEKTHILVENFDLYCSLLETGNYWTVLPKSLLSHFSSEHVCTLHEFHDLPKEKMTYLLKRRNQNLSPEAQTFLNILYGQLCASPYISLSGEFKSMIQGEENCV